jgi:phage baseplate assembly protein W
MKSISIPFRFESSSGQVATEKTKGKVVTTTNNSTIARQRIADVLATRRIERVNRPEYGAGISDLLFEPLDELIFADFRLDAINTLNDYVSNAEIRDLQIRTGNPIQYSGDGDSTLVVRVIYHTADTGTSTFTASIGQNTILTEESKI